MHGGAYTSLYQSSTVFIAYALQIFAGQRFGEKKYHLVGPIFWQFVWFFFISYLVIAPLSLKGAYPYFNSLPFAEQATQITSISSFVYIVWPIKALFIALSGVINRPKISLFFTTITSCLYIPVVWYCASLFQDVRVFPYVNAARECFAVLLFVLFFLRKNRWKHFGMHQWTVDFPLMRENISMGISRGMHRFNTLIGLVVSNAMSIHHQDHNVMEAYNLTMLLSFLVAPIHLAIRQMVVSACSQWIGEQRRSILEPCMRAGGLVSLLIGGSLALPLLHTPSILVSIHLIPPSFSGSDVLPTTCFWLWVFFIMEGINSILTGVLIALQEVNFLFAINAFASWIILNGGIFFFIYNEPHPSVHFLAFSCLGVVFLASASLWRLQTHFKQRPRLQQKVLMDQQSKA